MAAGAAGPDQTPSLLRRTQPIPRTNDGHRRPGRAGGREIAAKAKAGDADARAFSLGINPFDAEDASHDVDAGEVLLVSAKAYNVAGRLVRVFVEPVWLAANANDLLEVVGRYLGQVADPQRQSRLTLIRENTGAVQITSPGW